MSPKDIIIQGLQCSENNINKPMVHGVEMPISQGHMSPSAYDAQSTARTKKRVNVTVTILSIAGLIIEESDAGKKKKRTSLMSKMSSSRTNNNNNNNNNNSNNNNNMMDNNSACSSKENLPASNNNPATTIVASFSRLVNTKDGKAKTVMTHVPSLPLPPDAGSSSSSASSKKNPNNSVIQWPEQKHKDSGGGRVLSSHQFQRTFKREETTRATPMLTNNGSSNILDSIHSNTSHSDGFESSHQRFEAQPLSIQIAISRAGRMFKLGTAQLLLSGEEDGASSIHVPVRNSNPAAVAPKSNKFKVGKERRKAARVPPVPMMKLKGDTLKCGLDPAATLRVLVHVSEPIGETLDISPNLTVTMVPSPGPVRESRVPQREKHDAYADLPALPPTTAAREIGWGYVVKSSPVEVPVETTRGPVPMFPLQNDEEDDCSSEEEDYDIINNYDDNNNNNNNNNEPSCTSSAYMSFAVEDHHHNRHNHKYPSKSKMSRNYNNNNNNSNMARSHSTATTDSTMSDDFTFVSDLTEQPSWLSPSGIEVIPFEQPANTNGDGGANNDAKNAKVVRRPPLPMNSRLRYYEEEEEETGYSTYGYSTHGHSTHGHSTHGHSTHGYSTHGYSTAADTRTSVSSSGSASNNNSSSLPRRPKKASWRQRLSCGLPNCGSSSSIDAYHAAGGSVDDHDHDHDDDDDDLASEDATHARNDCSPARDLVGRCDPMEIRTGASYLTDEDDVWLAEYNEGDDDDDSSESSAGSTFD